VAGVSQSFPFAFNVLSSSGLTSHKTWIMRSCLLFQYLEATNLANFPVISSWLKHINHLWRLIMPTTVV